MKSKIVEANEKIAEDVTTGFQKIQDGVVNEFSKNRGFIHQPLPFERRRES